MDRVLVSLTFVCVIIAIIPLASILYFVSIRGISAMNLDFFTKLPPTPLQTSGGGMGDAIQGTLLLVSLAACIGIPFGIFTGVYVSEYGHNFFGRTVRFLGDVLVGNPSIVVGVLALVLVVFPLHGYNLAAGVFALAVIMIPVISIATAEALKLVPNSIREASVALGVRRWRTVLLVVANAKSAVATGVLLAIARVMGETAPLLLTVGTSYLWFSGLREPIASLPWYIFSWSTQPYAYWQELAWGAAFILIVMIMGINIAVRIVTRGKRISA